METERIRTVCKAMHNYGSSKMLYEDILKQNPQLGSKLKLSNLFAPQEFIITTLPQLIAPTLAVLTSLGITAVHLEGQALSVRNVPLDMPTEAVQVSLQKQLQPQIIFVDMFKPKQPNALHLGVGKVYVTPEAWTSPTFASFRESITPSDVLEPFISVPHDDSRSHLSPMYMRLWKTFPRKSKTSARQNARIPIHAPPPKSPPNFSRSKRASASLSPAAQNLTQMVQELQKITANQFELMAERNQALHEKLATRVDAVEAKIDSISLEIESLNANLGQIVKILARHGQMMESNNDSVLTCFSKLNIQDNHTAQPKQMEDLPSTTSQMETNLPLEPELLITAEIVVENENKRNRSNTPKTQRKALAPPKSTPPKSNVARPNQSEKISPARTPHMTNWPLTPTPMGPEPPFML